MADPKAPLPGGQVVIDDCKDDGLFHGRHRPPGDVTGEWWPVTEEAPVDNKVWARQNGVWVEVVGSTPTDYGTGLVKDETATPPIVHLTPAGVAPQFLGGVYVPTRDATQAADVDTSGGDGKLVVLTATDVLLGGHLEPPKDGFQYTRQWNETAQVWEWVQVTVEGVDYGLGLAKDETAAPPVVNLTPAGVTQPLLGGVYVPTRDATQAADVDTNGGDGRLVVLTATDALLGGILEPVKDGTPYERQWNETAQIWEWVQPTATGLDFGTGLSKDETATPPIVNLQPAGDSPDTLGGVYVVDRVRNVEEGLELGIDGRLRAPLATPRLAGTIVEPEDDGKGYVRTTLNGVSAWVPPADTLTDYGTGLSYDETATPPIVNLQPALDIAIGGIMEPPQDGIAHSRQFDVATQTWIWVPALTAGLQITGLIPDKAVIGDPIVEVHAYGSEFTPTCVIVVDGTDASSTTYISPTELTFPMNPSVPSAPSIHIVTVRETDPALLPVPPGTGLGAEQFEFIVASVQVDYGTGLSFDTAPTPPMVNLQPAGGFPQFLGGVFVPDRTHLQGLRLEDTDPLRLGEITVPLATDLEAGSIVEPPPDDKGYVRRRTAAGESAWVPPSDSGIIVQDEPPTQPVPPNSLWWDSNAGKLYLWYDDGTTVQWVQVDGGVPETTDFGIGLVLDETQDPKIVHLTPAGWDAKFLGGVYTTGGRSATEGLDLAAAGTGQISAPLATPDLAGTIVEPPANSQKYVRTTNEFTGVSSWDHASAHMDYRIGLEELFNPDGTRQNIVDLKIANKDDEIGGVRLIGRGPTQGLEFDISTGLLTAPLATDVAAGSIVDPPPDDKQYARQRTALGTSLWAEITPNTGGINDVEKEPVGEEYVRAYGRWLPVQKGGQVQPRKVNIGGDTMTGLLILSGNATDPLGAVAYQQLDALKVYGDLTYVNEAGVGVRITGPRIDLLPATAIEIGGLREPSGPGQFARLSTGEWVPVAASSPLTFRYGLEQTGDIVDITPATGGDQAGPPELGGVYTTTRSDRNAVVIDSYGHINVPPATSDLLGGMLEPVADGKGYVRASQPDGSYQWVPPAPSGGSVTISDTPPATPAHGDLWWESNSGTMFIWYDDGTSAQWVQTDASPEMPSYGIGLEQEGGVVNLKPANFNGEIGGVTVVARSMLQGLEYDVVSGTLWAPLADDKLPGVIVEPPPDTGASYTRKRENGVSTWEIASGSMVYSGDDPPNAPTPNMLWFDSNAGTLAIWYTDADSSQWVQVAGPPVAPPAGGIQEAPIDGTPYSRQDATWVQNTTATGAFLPLTGGTVTGALNVVEGPLTLSKTTTMAGMDPNGAFLVMNRTDPAQGVGIIAQNAGVESWKMVLSSGEITGFPGAGDKIQFIRSNAIQVEIDKDGNTSISGNLTVYGTFTDALLMEAVKNDPDLPANNVSALLLHALAEIKSLKAEVAALRGRH